jgi:hypothetical protein
MEIHAWWQVFAWRFIYPLQVFPHEIQELHVTRGDMAYGDLFI